MVGVEPDTRAFSRARSSPPSICSFGPAANVAGDPGWRTSASLAIWVAYQASTVWLSTRSRSSIAPSHGVIDGGGTNSVVTKSSIAESDIKSAGPPPP